MSDLTAIDLNEAENRHLEDLRMLTPDTGTADVPAAAAPSPMPKWEDTEEVAPTVRERIGNDYDRKKRPYSSGNPDGDLVFLPDDDRTTLEELARETPDAEETKRRIALAYFYANETGMDPAFCYDNIDQINETAFGKPTAVAEAHGKLVEAARGQVQHEARQAEIRNELKEYYLLSDSGADKLLALDDWQRRMALNWLEQQRLPLDLRPTDLHRMPPQLPEGVQFGTRDFDSERRSVFWDAERRRASEPQLRQGTPSQDKRSDIEYWEDRTRQWRLERQNWAQKGIEPFRVGAGRLLDMIEGTVVNYFRTQQEIREVQEAEKDRLVGKVVKPMAEKAEESAQRREESAQESRSERESWNRERVAEQRKILEELNRGANTVERAVNFAVAEFLPNIIYFSALSAMTGSPVNASIVGAQDHFETAYASISLDHPELSEDERRHLAGFSVGISTAAQCVIFGIGKAAQMKFLPVKTLAYSPDGNGVVAAQQIGGSVPRIFVNPNAAIAGNQQIAGQFVYAVDKSLPAYLKLWGINVGGGAAVGAFEKLAMNSVEIAAGIRDENRRWEDVGIQSFVRGGWGAYAAGRITWQLRNVPSVRQLRLDAVNGWREVQTPYQRWYDAQQTRANAQRVLTSAETPNVPGKSGGNPAVPVVPRSGGATTLSQVGTSPLAAAENVPAAPVANVPGNAERAKARIVADAADKYAAADQMALAGLEQRPPVAEDAPLEERQEAAARDASDIEVMDRELPGDPEESEERIREVCERFNLEIVEYPPESQAEKHDDLRVVLVPEWPPELLAKIEKQNDVVRNKIIPAFYDIGSKTCYFNTSLTRASKVDDLFVEEVLGHHGFREVLGPERARAFFLSLYRAFRDDPEFQALVRKRGLAPLDNYNDPEMEAMTEDQQAEAGEEMAAHIGIERGVTPEARRAPWYRRFVEWFREQFRKLFRLQLSKKAGERASEMFLREAAHKLRRGQVRQSKAGDGEGGIRRAFGGEIGASRMRDAEMRLRNLATAKQLAAEYPDTPENRRLIKLAYGWEKDAKTGKWHFELPDVKLKREIALPDGTKYRRTLSDVVLGTNGKLSEYFDAPELFEAYPELKDVKVVFTELDNPDRKGSYNSETNTITVNSEELIRLGEKIEQLEKVAIPRAEKASEKLLGKEEKAAMVQKFRDEIDGLTKAFYRYIEKDVLPHEVQHKIQEIEGFPQGTNVAEATQLVRNTPLLATPKYRKLIDDAEYLFEVNDYHIITEGWTTFDKLTDTNDEWLAERNAEAQKLGYDSLVEVWQKLDAMQEAETPYGKYRRFAGEVQARNASKRSTMTEDEKRQSLLDDTADVASEDRIYIYDALGENSMMAPLRPPGAPNYAEYPGNLRDSNVPAAPGFMQWAGLQGKYLSADYEFLYARHWKDGKNPYFKSPKEVQAATELVLSKPEKVADVNGNMSFVGFDEVTGDIYRLEIRKEVRGNSNQIRSIFKITAMQYEKAKLDGSPVLQPSPTGASAARTISSFIHKVAPSGEKSSGSGENGENGGAERLADDMDAALKQKFGSGNTSLRQVAAGFRKIEFQPGTVNLDLGGGKYDEATNYLAEKGVTNLVFDPVNRDADSNRRIFEAVKNGGVDTVTCNNVLNVIAEPAARDNVILQAAKALKPGGTAYFTVYEGDGSGAGRQSQADAWQENRKTADYLEEVKKHFGDVTLKNKVIIARQPLTEGKSSAWFIDASFENPLRFAIEDGDDSPLVEPKPFDPDRDVDFEDPDERAIAVLIPRYGAAAEFDDDEAADYLHGAGFDDVTPQQAHKLVARAREAYRKQRTAEIRHNNARRRDDWLYDNVPLYRHAVDFGGKGFKIRMPKDYAHKDDRGTLLAKPNEPGVDLIELAKYIGRVEGRPNEEKEIAEELADFYRDLKLPDLYRKYHDAVKETKEGEREIDRQAREEFARYLEDSARDLIERGEPVTREALEENRRLAQLLYDWILGKPLKGKISNADIDDINAALQNQGGNPRLVARISRAIREDLKEEYTEKMRDFRDKLRSEIRDAKAMAKEAEKMLREFIPPQYRGRYVDDLVKLANITNAAARQVEFDKLCQKITDDSQTAGGADLAAKVTKDKIYFELPKGERDRYLARLASIMKLPTPEKRIEAFDALQQEVMDAADAVRKVKYLERINTRLAQLTPKVNKSRRLIGTRTIEAQDSIAEIARVFSLSSAEVDDERQAAIEGQEAALDNGDAEGAAECMAKAKLLDVFGGLASRSGDEVYKAYDQLERIAATGRNDLLREIAEWQAGIDKIRQAVIRKVTSGRGVVTDKAAYDIRTKHNESKLAKLKEYAWGMFKPEDFIYLTAINGERGDWLENSIGKMFVRMHEISVEVAARMMAFREADGKAMDAAFGTKGEVGRARALQAFKEHRDDWGVTRLPASTRQIEFIPVTIDEARRLVAAFDRGERAVPTSEDAAHTLPIAEYQAEMLRAKLRDLDRRVKKEYNGQNSDKITRDIFNAMDAEDREKHGEQKTIGIPVVRFTGQPEAWDYTGEELLDEYLYWNQPDVRAKMQMNGWTEESGKQLEKAVPDKLKKYGAHMVDELRKIGEELDRIQQRTAHSRMTHVENYFPTVYDKPFWSEGNVPALDDKYASRMAPGRLAPGSLKERVAHTMEPKAIPAIAAYHEQMRRMIHYTGWAEFARDARAVFFHPDVRAAYDQTFGPEFYKAFSKSLVDTFNGGNADVSYNAFAQGILGAETSARMMFNWLSGIKQSLSGFAQLHDVPTADFFKSLVDAWTHPHEWIKDMADTPYFKVRLKNGADYFEYIALDSRNRYAAEAKSFGKAGKMLHLDAGKLAAAAQMLQITKYWSSGFTRLGDMFPCVVFGAAVYRYHYNRMIDQGFSPEEAKKHALLRWEISVDSLQQSPFVLNQNQWQRGGWATQMWTRWKTAQIENEQRVKRAEIAALVYGNGWTEYNTYLDVRIEDGKMRPVTDEQYKKLVKFYNDFPLGETVENKWGEHLIFDPLDPDRTEEYIHHFAVKRKGDKEEYFDEEYLELFKKLKPSLKNPDERLLTATPDGIPRIVYVKKIPTKNGNHVMVVNVAPDGRLLNWTHMDSKDAYVENLRKREREAVERFGLVDEHGNKLDLGYDEYMRKKADMRAYLAATQGPPGGDPQTEHAGDDNNIPPGGEKSSKKFYTGAKKMSYREQILRGFVINRMVNWLVTVTGGAILLAIAGKTSKEDWEDMLENSVLSSLLSTFDIFPGVGQAVNAGSAAATSKGDPGLAVYRAFDTLMLPQSMVSALRNTRRAFTLKDRRKAQEAMVDAAISVTQLLGIAGNAFAVPGALAKQSKRAYRLVNPPPDEKKLRAEERERKKQERERKKQEREREKQEREQKKLRQRYLRNFDRRYL